MAGEPLLPIQECPDLISETLCFVVTEGTSLVPYDGKLMPFFYAERDTVLDAASSSWGFADTDGGTLTIKRYDGTTYTNMSTALDAEQAIDTSWPYTIIETANIIPAGSLLGVVWDAGDLNLKYVTFQMRIRTRIRGTA